MSGNSIRRNLRAALDEAISRAKDQLIECDISAQKSINEGKKKMMPVINFLEALKEESGHIGGLEINPDLAIVETDNGANYHRLEIHYSYAHVDGSEFVVEECDHSKPTYEDSEKTHYLDSEEAVLNKVIDVIARHEAVQQMLKYLEETD